MALRTGPGGLAGLFLIVVTTVSTPADAGDLALRSLSRSPSAADFDGMNPTPFVHREMARVSGFIQREPTDGASATEETEAYLGHDAERLYVAFLCFDRNPSAIRARKVPRDAIADADAAARVLELTATLRPTASLAIDNQYFYTSLRDAATGGPVFSNHILRSRWNYQISARLSLRAIGQYESLSPNETHSSLVRRRQLNGDLLLAYRLHPGTAILFGYNHDRQSASAMVTEPIEASGRREERQADRIFVKVSYLWRF